MNTWNDIYDFSEKVLSYILRKKEEEYIQPDQDSPVEKMADKFRKLRNFGRTITATISL